MLPLVEDSVLQNNPQFAALYKTLTTVVLNPDGTSRDDAVAKKREANKEDLRNVRLQAAKDHLLEQALATAVPTEAPTEASLRAATRRTGRAAGFARPPPSVASPPPPAEVSPELADLMLLLPQLVQAAKDEKKTGQSGSGLSSSSLSRDELELLLSSPPMTSLPDHIPEIAQFVSARLHADALALARIVHPTTNPSFVHRQIPNLPSHVASLRQAVDDQSRVLARARHDAATAALRLLAHEAAVVLPMLLRALEAKHGPVARSLELRAAATALEAQSVARDADRTVQDTHKAVYPADAAAALKHYADHLRDSRARLDESIRDAKAILKDYGVDVDAPETEDASVSASQQEKIMRELARVHGELTKELDEVNSDLARLGK